LLLLILKLKLQQIVDQSLHFLAHRGKISLETVPTKLESNGSFHIPVKLLSRSQTLCV
jgi:hypothetical protein